MKRYGFTLIEAVAILAATMILAALLLPVLAQNTDAEQTPENADRLQCLTNLKQLALGIRQYTQDYDEKFPVVASSTPKPFGWSAAIQPYVRNTEFLQCPSEKHAAGANPYEYGYTDYWYNRNLAHCNQAQIDWDSSTLMLGDGDGGYKTSNARYALNALPRVWLEAFGSPARRHGDGANYAFVDGHATWLKTKSISIKPPSGVITSTFAVALTD